MSGVPGQMVVDLLAELVRPQAACTGCGSLIIGGKDDGSMCAPCATKSGSVCGLSAALLAYERREDSRCAA